MGGLADGAGQAGRLELRRHGGHGPAAARLLRADLAQAGDDRRRPGAAPADARAALLLPAGNKGPALLVFRNYDAIYSYNAAESYALAIATLADQLRGGNELATAWPTDDPGIGRDERRQLQTLLLARGHDIGEIDGMLGDRSRTAVRAEQTRLGHEVNGRAGQRLLRALRAEVPAAPPPVTPSSSSGPAPRS